MAKRRPANPKRPTDATIRIPCFSLPGTYPFYPNFVPILLKFGTYFEIILEQTSFHSTNLKWPQNLTLESSSWDSNPFKFS